MLCLLLLCTGIVLAAPDTAQAGFDYQNWMKYLPDDMQISQINLPGTHDSGTVYPVYEPTQSKIFNEAMEKLAKTQDKTVAQQLDAGIRVFDIRVRKAKSGKNELMDLVLCHGLATCYRKTDDCGRDVPLVLSRLMDWANSFLNAHQSETVVFIISEEDDKNALRTDILPRFFKQFIPGQTHRAGYERFDYYKALSDVPPLGKVRGRCILIWDGDRVDDSSKSVSTYTTYEMHYKNYKPENTTPAKKAGYIAEIIDDVNTYGWYQNYFGESNDKFEDSNYRYPTNKPSSVINTPVNIGTNVTTLNDDEPISSAIKTGHDPLVDQASTFFKNFKYSNKQWPVGYRYGWITMDYPTGDIIKIIARTNYGLPAYDYTFTVTGIPAGQEKNLKITLNNVHETFRQEDVTKQSGSVFSASRLIHTTERGIEQDQISATITLEYNGKVYRAQRVSRTFTGHDPMADDKPGYWGAVTETYKLIDLSETIEVPLPTILWIGDSEDYQTIRPKNMQEYFGKCGDIVLKRSASSTGSELITICTSVRGDDPFVDESKVIHTYVFTPNGRMSVWKQLTVKGIPKYNDYVEAYTYEFVGVTNTPAGCVYDIDYSKYYESLYKDPTINMKAHQIKKQDWVNGPTISFVDDGAGSSYRKAALEILASQGITVYSYRKDSSLFDETVVKGSNLKITQKDEYTYTTQVRTYVTDEHRADLRHEFDYTKDLPQYSWHYDYIIGNRFCLMGDVDITVHWNDGGNTTLRPDTILFQTRNIAYFTHGYITNQELVDENTWSMTRTVPAYYIDTASGAVRVQKYENVNNVVYQDVQGYTKTKANRQTGDLHWTADVSYTLQSGNTVALSGDIYWLDGPLNIDHSAIDPMINVLQDGAVYVIPSGQQPVYNEDKTSYRYSHDAAHMNDFPLWKSKVDGEKYTYSVTAQATAPYTVNIQQGLDVLFIRKITVSGSINWEGDVTDPHAIPQVTLMRDGEFEAGPITCTGNAYDGFSYSFDDLTIAPNNEVFYDYTITVTVGDSSIVLTQAAPQRDAEGNLTINATMTAKQDNINVQIPVQLIRENVVPAVEKEAFYFQITCTTDPTLLNKQFKLDPSNNFRTIFTLPDLLDHNKTYTFEVRQLYTDLLPYWVYDKTVGTAQVTVRYLDGSATPSYVIAPAQEAEGTEYLTLTNRFQIPTFDLQAEVVWNMGSSSVSIPDSTSLTLSADNVPQPPVKATAAGNWTYIWKDLPLYKATVSAIEPIYYDVAAEELEGFVLEVDGTWKSTDGFVVTYTQNTRIDIPVSIEWDFTHRDMTDVPDSLPVTLKEINDAGEETDVATITLTKDANWEGKFPDILEFRQPVSAEAVPVARQFTVETEGVDYFRIEVLAENGRFRILMHESPHAGIQDITQPKSNALNAQIIGDLSPFLEKGEERYLVRVWLEAKQLSGLTYAENTAVRSVLAKKEKILAMLDITAWKQVTNRSSNNGEQQMHQLPGGEISVQVNMPMPNANDSKMLFDVIRIHNGKAERIPCTQDHVQKTITFRSDKFSTYVITGRKIPVPPPTGDDSNLPLTVGMLMLSLSALVVLMRKRKAF